MGPVGLAPVPPLYVPPAGHTPMRFGLALVNQSRPVAQDGSWADGSRRRERAARMFRFIWVLAGPAAHRLLEPLPAHRKLCLGPAAPLRDEQAAEWVQCPILDGAVIVQAAQDPAGRGSDR
jgi:hypothetical protein